MTNATASLTEAAPTDICTIFIPDPNRKAKDDDSHTGTQQTSRFLDLPAELRDMIYDFAFCPNTQNTQDGETSDKPLLTAGLSNSTTARALSQVCRTVRQESTKAYYTNTTFVVRDLPDRFADSMERLTSVDRPIAPAPNPLDLWARTWGVLGAQHIRSLYISPLKGSVRISMASEANPVTFDEGACANLSASARELAGLKAFGRHPGRGMTAARKIEMFLCEVGDAWCVAWRKKALAEMSAKYNDRQVCERDLQRLEEALTDICTSVFALDSVILKV